MNITSGSVIGPVLTGALLEQGKMVISIGVTATESAIEVSNTVKTIQSYDAISQKTGKPVVLSIQKNSDSDTFEKINEAVISTILLLATLASRKNAGLDSADLRNWLHYDRVSKAPVKAVTLDITNGSFAFNDGTHPITVASLVRPGVPTKLDWTPDYQCVGYVNTGDGKGFDQPMHYTICDGELAVIFEQLDALQKDLERKAAARQYSGNTLAGVKDVQDDGLVL